MDGSEQRSCGAAYCDRWHWQREVQASGLDRADRADLDERAGLRSRVVFSIAQEEYTNVIADARCF